MIYLPMKFHDPRHYAPTHPQIHINNQEGQIPLELPKTKPPPTHETIIKREREAIGLIKKKFPTNHANTTTNKRTKCSVSAHKVSQIMFQKNSPNAGSHVFQWAEL
ncbi:hypothetical protein DPMN_020194 [Dreissena polymorpha]|uniref:Uncharacterized protein n=1 Tax=Dreissena polymorpha TaxID=45954 RepID=A0A9D4S9Z8_DREPO|nr:hypothetical protein DPMN_020194 [Dreissena polymorpha]